jgi:Arc/MetJ-type ribon-helix-helix transcriptional regulator
MAISVRLDKETEDLLDRLARVRKTSRSDIVRESIRLLADHEPGTQEVNVYEAIKDIIGSVRSGRSDLSGNTGKRFREILLEKKRRGRL